MDGVNRSKLLGKGGWNVKNLRETYGVRFEVPREQERPVSVRGRRPNVKAAVDLLVAVYGALPLPSHRR